MLTRVEPSVRILLESCRSAGTAGRWQVAWRVHNDGDQPLRIDDAWVPHGRFRGEAGRFPVNLAVRPGEWGQLELIVLAAEAPGVVVENAFLILRTDRGRMFARMRIDFGHDGAPQPYVVRVSAQSLQ